MKKSIKQKIYEALVTNKGSRTAAQMACQFRTTQSSIRSRISELFTQSDVIITAQQRLNTKGKSVTYYVHVKPSKKCCKKS